MEYTGLRKIVAEGVCRGCRRRETTLVKLTDTGKTTKTEMKICRNPECSFYIDAGKLKTWRVKSSFRCDRDFYRQHTQKWVRAVKDPE